MQQHRQAAAADAQGRVANEDRRQAHEYHPDPEALPDDYAQWLDSWMFSPEGDTQQQEAEG